MAVKLLACLLLLLIEFAEAFGPVIVLGLLFGCAAERPAEYRRFDSPSGPNMRAVECKH